MSALEEDRDFLLRSLEDLEREREAGDLDESDYVALKEDYTARAAAVLRALAADPEAADPAGREAAGPAEPGPAGAGPPRGTEGGDGHVAAGVPAGGPQARRRLSDRAPTGGGRSRWRPVAVGAVLLAFASAAGLLVARSAGERLPGDPATGEIAATGPSSENADELAVARDLIGEGRTLDAIKAYDRILERDPEQPEALAYRGWLLRLAGKAAGDTSLVDKGMEFIERAVAADPGYPDARFFRAFVNYQDRRDPAAAVPDLRAYLAGESPPEMRPVVEDLLRRALADAERGVTSPEPVPAPPTTTPPG
ncbi:MAG TPA: hypothetical protein VM242_14280 [Acidimicrobiales bacterium]|nr:hypothetical protein [Acidimicrobiales bacterium]